MLKKLKKPFITLVIVYVLYRLIPIPSPGFGKYYSTVIKDDSNNILRVFLNKNEQFYFPAISGKVPDKLMKAILMYEDRYFFYHPGINPVSIMKAMYKNVVRGRVVSGASTITMQVIRIWGKKRRTFLNKIAEIIQTVKLDFKYSKEEILRMYVNNAPYGGNIIGVGAASYRYFGKPPDHLTWGEASLLAVLPNSPGRVTPVLNRKKLIVKRNKLLRKLFNNGEFDNDILELSLKEPVPVRFKSFPFNVPHLSRYLRSKFGGNGKFIETTIDLDIQKKTRAILKRNMEFLEILGITNGAVVIAETRTGKVRAYCGSKDFFDVESSGQVDGVNASRSSGSILKPFLYAMAVDEGYLLERTLIKDIPSYFGSFSPSNSGGGFDGVVTAKEALIRSLNVPAVRVLNKLGLEKFYMFLTRAGVKSLVRQPHSYGLTLVLGGAEVRLIDLLGLYRGLGKYGDFEPLQIVKGIKKSKTGNNNIISRSASLLTLNILKELKRPGAEYYWEQYSNKNPVGWKTGTSYGQRDAWSVGVNPSWTIAVWVGNFSGEGNNNLGGAKSAAPVMFDLFNSLPRIENTKWFNAEKETFVKVELCKDSGFTAGRDCEDTILVDGPSGTRSLPVCPFHKTIYTTMDGKMRVCSLCWESGKYTARKILLFPPDVSQFLRERGNILDLLPPHKKSCPSIEDYKPVKIIYPVNNGRILLPRDFNGKIQAVSFKAASSVKGRRIYWYIDRKYIGSTKERHKISVSPGSGKHSLEVVDQEGNRAGVNFYITRSGRG